MKKKNCAAISNMCIPAVIYFIIGITAIVVDITHFIKSYNKSQQLFAFICLKIVVIFLITMFLHWLCCAGHNILSSVITFITCLFLIKGMIVVMSENGSMKPLQILPVTTIHRQPDAIVTAVNMIPPPLVNAVINQTPEKLIGLNSRSH
jgi:hypothetical protein